MAVILREATADAEGLVGGEEAGKPERSQGRGLGPSSEKNEFRASNDV